MDTKRNSLKKLAGISAMISVIPSVWVKPVLNSVVLPAHAQTSIAFQSGIYSRENDFGNECLILEDSGQITYVTDSAATSRGTTIYTPGADTVIPVSNCISSPPIPDNPFFIRILEITDSEIKAFQFFGGCCSSTRTFTLSRSTECPTSFIECETIS